MELPSGDSDITQNLTETAIQFLVEKGIDGIISLNQYPYTDAQHQALKKANIEYLHVPVVDFTPPTMAQLKDIVQFHERRETTSTLIHCGYGYSRTGAALTAIQLYATKGENPNESEWTKVNKVESRSQMSALREYQNSLR